MNKLIFSVPILLLSSFVLASAPLLENPITYHPNASVEERVKSECQIEAMLAEQVSTQLKRLYRTDNALLEKGGNPAGSPVLRLQITYVLGVGGGAWTGPKAITISAELLGDDGQIRRTKINRWSVGGAFGGFRGTCSILSRCAVSIGKDLARWVKDPSFRIKEIPAPPDALESKELASSESQVVSSDPSDENLLVRRNANPGTPVQAIEEVAVDVESPKKKSSAETE